MAAEGTCQLDYRLFLLAFTVRKHLGSTCKAVLPSLEVIIKKDFIPLREENNRERQKPLLSAEQMPTKTVFAAPIPPSQLVSALLQDQDTCASDPGNSTWRRAGTCIHRSCSRRASWRKVQEQLNMMLALVPFHQMHSASVSPVLHSCRDT